MDQNSQESQNQEPNQSYWANIPSYILDDERLSHAEMILYARLSSLMNKWGYCFASDKYLCSLMKVEIRQLKRLLKNLEECGYIRRETKRAPGGIKWERKIFSNFNYEGSKMSPRRVKNVPSKGQKCPLYNKSVTSKEYKPPSEVCTERGKPLRRQPPDSVSISFSNGKLSGITEEDRQLWRQTFPGVNLDQEILKMQAWLDANPTKRPRSRYKAFIVRWLTKAQNDISWKEASKGRYQNLPVDRRTKNIDGTPVDSPADGLF